MYGVLVRQDLLCCQLMPQNNSVLLCTGECGC